MVGNDKRRDAGFTMIELVITMALTVVAMAIVAPQTAKSFHQSEVRSAANEVHSVHTLARTTAIQYGRRVSLMIGTGQGRGQARTNLLTLRADTSLAQTGEVLLRAISLRDVDLVSDRRLLCFDARGLPYTDAECEQPDATMIVKNVARADTLRFSPLGDRLP
ncbi:MAG: GspH/FimT family pseudopilin [Gemmatimonadota bacterium]|nr:GspH/FimT family pseudopilin [Gemmatimonadota bacterium]